VRVRSPDKGPGGLWWGERNTPGVRVGICIAEVVSQYFDVGTYRTDAAGLNPRAYLFDQVRE